MGMLPFLLKEIAPIRIFGQELFTFVFISSLYNLSLKNLPV